MADEDRQSDKMALTVLLVVLLVRKIDKKKLCRNLFNRHLSSIPVFKIRGSHMISHNLAIAQEASHQHDFTQHSLRHLQL